LQFPIVLAKATTIHKSRAATLHQGVHARLDATCKEEGQAYVALSRCPQQALCTLEYFTPKSLRFNSTAEWALTKLKAQQADRDGSRLWKQLFEPPESKEFYEARLAEMGTPNWSKMKRDKEKIQDGEQLWLCLQCGQEAPNAKAGIKAHKRKCPAKLEAKANAKAKAKMAKSKGKTKCRSQSTRTDGVAEQNGAAGPQQEPPFFERQEAARCGIHALNNVLGFHCVGVEDMTHAAETFLFENPDLGDNVQDHLAPEGDYSIEVMSMVLRTKAMAEFGQLRWQMDIQRVMTSQDLHGCIGAVQNLNNRHWVALRQVEATFLYCDSLEAGLRQMTEEELDALLAVHPTYALRYI
ncbi:prmt1, partial [Symbiodinium pilosum]